MKLREITTYYYKSIEKIVNEKYFVDSKNNRQEKYKQFFKSGNPWKISFYKNNLLDGKSESFTYLDTHFKIETNFYKKGLGFGQSFTKRINY